MKIRIAGAYLPSEAMVEDPDEPVDPAFRRLNVELGRQAALKDYTLMLGSILPQTADPHALRGVVEYAQEEPSRTFRVEFHVLEGYALELPAHPDNLTIVKHAYTENPDDRKLGARFASISGADAVICVGGERGTRAIDTFAQILTKRLVGLPQFDGAGNDIFQRVKHSLTPEQRASLMAPLDSDDSYRHVATAAIDLLGSEAAGPAKPVSYFISYSHDDASIADHVEVLLRRFQRLVVRDETKFMIGDDLDAEIKESIEGSGSFIAIYSEAYSTSDYCKGELEFARKLKRERDVPLRILLLKVEPDADLPISLGGYLSIPADSRERRELAVRKILDGEDMG